MAYTKTNWVDGTTSITAAQLNRMENGIGNIDANYVQSFSGVQGNGILVVTATFFTNGGSNSSDVAVSFGRTYSAAPVVMPANLSNFVSYSDTIMYPYIYNITTTGFSVTIRTAGGQPLGGPSAANVFMNFVVFGK